jgi:hypothetical protein
MNRKPERFDQDNDADIVRWFEALGPPPEGQVSPHLRTEVLTRIEQRRSQSGIWAWLPHGNAPLWRPALAVALLLSVGLNVWWGVYSRPTPPSWSQNALQAYRFLRAIRNPEQLGPLVTARSAFGARIVGLGFAPQNPRIVFFRMGTIYADALAALRGDAPDVAAQRLHALRQALERLQAPRILTDYLREIRTLHRGQHYGGEELATFLALFETLYQVEYAKDESTEAVGLFQLGAWLETMTLAAVAKDTTALHQEAAVRHFQTVLGHIEAPREALEALKRLGHYVSAEPMTDNDIRTILTLVRRIQQILGEA